MSDSTRKPRRQARDVQAAIKRSVANDGAPIVLVPLPDGRLVTVDAADYDRLTRLGLCPTWVFNDAGNGHSYVRTRFPSGRWTPNNIQVARAIMAPPPGHIVKYVDGDSSNLRRPNLVVIPRASRAKARERLWEVNAAA